MTQSVLTLTPTSRPLGQSLGFTARSVVVDNYTSSYLLLPDAGKTIPPWTYGAVVPLPEGIRQAVATLVATVPAVPGPPVPASQATLTWTDQPLPADPGHLLQQSQYGIQQVIGTLSGAAGTTPAASFNVPAGTQAIGFIVYGTAGFNGPQNVVISGRQTGNVYMQPANPPNANGPQMALFGSSDALVDVSMICNATASSKIDVLASPVLPVVDVLTAAGIAIPVSTDLKPYDWRISGSFDGVAATLNSPTFAAGVRIVIASYVCTIVSGAAVAYAGTLNFSDAGGTFWRDAVAIPAVADSADHARMTDLRAKGLGDTPMTMALNNVLPPNVSARFSAGGYVV